MKWNTHFYELDTAFLNRTVTASLRYPLLIISEIKIIAFETFDEQFSLI